jgi:hypothetical protein
MAEQVASTRSASLSGRPRALFRPRSGRVLPAARAAAAMAAGKASSLDLEASKVLIRFSSGSWARAAWIESRSVWYSRSPMSSQPCCFLSCSKRVWSLARWRPAVAVPGGQRYDQLVTGDSVALLSLPDTSALPLPLRPASPGVATCRFG